MDVRRKGHQFERDTANKLREIWPSARRLVQTSIYDKRKIPDVEAGPFDIECKKGQRINVPAAIRQAKDEARQGKTPVVVLGYDRIGKYAVIEFEEFVHLCTAVYGLHCPQAIEVQYVDRAQRNSHSTGGIPSGVSGTECGVSTEQ